MEGGLNSVKSVEKSKCYSCRSCELSCPRGAIKMEENEEGFFYPKVDFSCVDCGICKKSCPALSAPKTEFPKKTFAAFLKDEEKRLQSTSGALATAFAEKTLHFGGVAFGAAYDKNLSVAQIFVTDENDLHRLKGSKYVESDTGSSFLQAKNFLEEGRRVFYSGTPCQIAGLKKFLSKDYENLFTADLICHGIPSRKLFQKYLRWLGNRTGGKIIYYGFRDKDVGGWSCGGKTKTKTKTKTIDGSLDPYYSSFLRGETYRESCYSCPFSNLERVGDITLGDFWGVEKFHPQVEKEKGVSCVLVNTKKGGDFLAECEESLVLISSDAKNAAKENSNLNSPTARPKIRDSIYKGIDDLEEKEFFRRFREGSFFYRFKFKTKRLFLRLALRITPRPIKRAAKSLLQKWRGAK